jgi:hypothetical protein
MGAKEKIVARVNRAARTIVKEKIDFIIILIICNENK